MLYVQSPWVPYSIHILRTYQRISTSLHIFHVNLTIFCSLMAYQTMTALANHYGVDGVVSLRFSISNSTKHEHQRRVRC